MYVSESDLSNDISKSVKKVDSSISSLSANLYQYWSNDFETCMNYKGLHREIKELHEKYKEICEKYKVSRR